MIRRMPLSNLHLMHSGRAKEISVEWHNYKETLLATIKLNTKPVTADKAARKPVRPLDPNKRTRTSAPAPKPFSDEVANATIATATEQKPVAQKSQSQRQRNHRHDGTLREPDAKPNLIRDETGRDTPRRGGKTRDGFEAGNFNRDRATNPMFAPKPLPTNPDQPRLSKRMTELGLCSRREADEWISNGWVRVDGVVVDVLGTRVSLDATIEVSKAAQQHQSETVTIILHKPMGYVSGQAEDGYQPAITLINPDNHWAEDPSSTFFKRGHLQGLAPAGRLDIDSTGLLVFTQDGRIAKHLIGENSTVEKEYLVRVEGTLSAEGLKKLNFGLSLDGVNLKPAKVSWQNEDQLRFVLREGRKRQIRRMCELVGIHVVGLKRIRIGSVTLSSLPVGAWRYLRMNERF